MINAAVAIHPTRHADRSRRLERVSGGASIVSILIWFTDWTPKARVQCTVSGAPLSSNKSQIQCVVMIDIPA